MATRLYLALLQTKFLLYLKVHRDVLTSGLRGGQQQGSCSVRHSDIYRTQDYASQLVCTQCLYCEESKHQRFSTFFGRAATLQVTNSAEPLPKFL